MASSHEDYGRLTHCQAHVASLLPRSPVYGHFLSGIEIVSASQGTVVARLELLPLHLNSKGTLHGSVIATLVDFIGGVAIASWDLRDSTGVSTDMHISFVGIARAGEVIEVEGTAVKVGGSLAFTTATIRTATTAKTIVATGTHTKFVRGPR